MSLIQNTITSDRIVQSPPYVDILSVSLFVLFKTSTSRQSVFATYYNHRTYYLI